MGYPAPTLPEMLADRYRVGDLLGTGGMGVIVRARDTLLDRDVAIKLLGESLVDDDEAQQRFAREGRSAARVSHPNVVRVYDVGDHEGRPFLVMELVEGPSLADRLGSEGALSPAEVERVARDALAGLQSVHETGLLHRDMKPGNLLQESDGTVKVTDFGIARSDDSATLTRTGFVLGTLMYLAPERRRGEDATIETDLFALAATLMHLLAGEPPSMDEPLDLPDGTPDGLATFLGRSLAPDPSVRPSSAREGLALIEGEGVDTTQVLPAQADTTVAVSTTAPSADPDQPTQVDRPTRDRPTTQDPATRIREGMSKRTVRWIVGMGIALVVVIALVLAFNASSPDASAPVDGVEVTENAAETARRLAEFIREQAG